MKEVEEELIRTERLDPASVPNRTYLLFSGQGPGSLEERHGRGSRHIRRRADKRECWVCKGLDLVTAFRPVSPPPAQDIDR